MSVLSAPRATTKGLLLLRRVQVGYHDARGVGEAALKGMLKDSLIKSRYKSKQDAR